MKILYVGDTHIDERAIPELNVIFDEICQIKADRLVQLGDWFDKNRPTPLELRYSTEIVLKLLKCYKEIVFISGTGEHDLFHDTSVIEHLAALGVKTIKGNYVDNNILCGHFFTNESRLEYGTHKYTVTELKKYKYVFLGHQHNPQDISNNIYHVGSVRYQHWNEVTDKNKQIILIDTEKDTLDKIVLKTPIKMVDVYSLDELAKLDSKLQARLVVTSFDQYKKDAALINAAGKRFHDFKLKLEFKDTEKEKTVVVKVDLTKNKDVKDAVREAISKIEDVDVRNLLADQFKDK